MTVSILCVNAPLFAPRQLVVEASTALRETEKDGKRPSGKFEGMLLASRAMLQRLADFVRESVPEPGRPDVMLKIGTAMAELIDISRMLYELHPELDPYPGETRIAAEMSRDKKAES